MSKSVFHFWKIKSKAPKETPPVDVVSANQLQPERSKTRRVQQPREEELQRKSKKWSCQRCELQAQEHKHEVDRLHRENQELRTALDQSVKDQEKWLNDLSYQNRSVRSTVDLDFSDSKRMNGPKKSFSSSFRISKKWSFKRCEKLTQEHKQQMSEMEAFYNNKLTEARSALKEKEEQLRSFKDRVAQNVVLSLKTENTENMNSPVNQSRLTEMYQQLRVCTWPNIHFSSSDSQARVLVQKKFGEAAEHMKTVTETVCGGQAASAKVEKFRQTALENLQLALFHSSREDVFKAAFPQYHATPADLLFASECYWLGCLMALHSPPLRPHWDRADPSVFPREIRPERRRVNRVTKL